MNFSIVVATNKINGIGYNNNNTYTIPWKSKEDMMFFKKLTTGNELENNAIIMGKNTYLSLNKELPNRKNIIISSTLKNDNLTIFKTLDEALIFCKDNKIANVFVIGGSLLYKEALTNRYLTKIYWNIIQNNNECNIFFPYTLDEYTKLKSLNIINHKINENVHYYIFEIFKGV